MMTLLLFASFYFYVVTCNDHQLGSLCIAPPYIYEWLGMFIALVLS